MEYAQIIVVAILVEAIWENLKMVWKDKQMNFNMLGVLLVSIIVCLLTNADIFPLIGLNMSVPCVGCILTGIIASRGANFVNDLFSKLNGKE